MKTKRGVLLAIILAIVFLLPSTSADIVSINSGGSNQTAITSNKHIEGFFLGGQKQVSDKGGSGGGGGSSEEENETFKLNKDQIRVSAYPGESVDGCFTATNPKEEAIFDINANLKGDVKEYAEMQKNSFNLMPGLSEQTCLTFSSEENEEPQKNTGTINVSKKESKIIDVSFKILENKTEPSQTTPGGGGTTNETNETEENEKETQDPLEDIKNLIIWIPLLIIIIIFLVIKKYIKFTSEISGKKTREQRIAAAERIKRSQQRKESNIFERAINKAAITLAEGTINTSKKSEKTKHSSKKFSRK